MSNPIRFTEQLTLDLGQPNDTVCLFSKQFDNASRFINCHLVTHGVDFPVDPDAVVTVNVKRPDGETDRFRGLAEDDGSVTVPVPAFLLAVKGKHTCDISVYSSDTSCRLSSASFTIEVEEAVSGDEIADDDEHSVIDEFIARVGELSDVATSGSYLDLSDTPTVPEALSDLTNDTGFITAQAIAGKADASSLSAVALSGAYADLSGKPAVPTKVSDLENDAGYLTAHQDISGKADLDALADVATSGDYDDLTGKPLKLSDFSNDSGFMTADTITGVVTFYGYEHFYTGIMGDYADTSGWTVGTLIKISSSAVPLLYLAAKEGTDEFPATEAAFIAALGEDGYVAAHSFTFRPFTVDLIEDDLPDPDEKADKVTDGTAGHLASLTSGGNLADSGIDALHVAADDGNYPALIAGCSYNLIDKYAQGSLNSFVFRPTAGQLSVVDDGSERETAEIKSIHGKTIVWNQAVKPFASGAQSWHTVFATNTFSDGVITVTPTQLNARSYFTHEPIAGHKYYTSCLVKASSANQVLNIGFNHYYTTVTGTTNWTRCESLFSASSSSTLNYLFQLESGDIDVYSAKNGMIFDLTMMFGAGNEPQTTDEFRSMFPLDHYAYDAGSLLSYNGTGIKTVGFNAYDHASGTAKLIGGKEYQITGSFTSLSYSTGETITPDEDGNFTPSKNGVLTVTGGDSTTTCIHLVHSGYRDGDYEPYHTETLDLPIGTYFPTGMKSAGTVYDELTKDKAVQRICSRAYESGDESDPAVITDGTTTFYPLDDPVETPIVPALSLSYEAEDFGTEEALPANDETPVTAPFCGVITYNMDFARTAANLVTALKGGENGNIPMFDGSSPGFLADSGLSKAVLTRLSAIPEPPAEDGSYTLTVTVSDGTVTYSWVSDAPQDS